MAGAMLDSFSPLVPLSVDMYLPAFPQIAATSGRVGPLAVDPVDLHDRHGDRPGDVWGLGGSVEPARSVVWGVLIFAIATAGYALAGSINALMACRAVVRDRFDAT